MNRSRQDAEQFARPRELPCIRAIRPRCSDCGSASHRTRRSVRLDEETSRQWVTCRGCGKNFSILWE